MKLRLRPEAQADILEAAEWYEERQSGRGIIFVTEIENLFRRIAEGPRRFRLARSNVRVALCQRFPYAIYFLPEEDGIVILAVLHQRRDHKLIVKRLRN